MSPARFLFVGDPAMLLQRGVHHLPEALDLGAHVGLQPASVRVEEDDRTEAAELALLLFNGKRPNKSQAEQLFVESHEGVHVHQVAN